MSRTVWNVTFVSSYSSITTSLFWDADVDVDDVIAAAEEIIVEEFNMHDYPNWQDITAVNTGREA